MGQELVQTLQSLHVESIVKFNAIQLIMLLLLSVMWPASYMSVHDWFVSLSACDEMQLPGIGSSRDSVLEFLAETLGQLESCELSLAMAGMSMDTAPLVREAAVTYSVSPVHPRSTWDALKSMISLAHTYWNSARFEEAKALYEKVLVQQTSMLGTDHPDTLQSMSNLASTYNSFGSLRGSESTSCESIVKAGVGPW
jgi:hypothetical protein